LTKQLAEPAAHNIRRSEQNFVGVDAGSGVVVVPGQNVCLGMRHCERKRARVRQHQDDQTIRHTTETVRPSRRQREGPGFSMHSYLRAIRIQYGSRVLVGLGYARCKEDTTTLVIAAS
jgi:hypothetical protein